MNDVAGACFIAPVFHMPASWPARARRIGRQVLGARLRGQDNPVLYSETRDGSAVVRRVPV